MNKEKIKKFILAKQNEGLSKKQIRSKLLKKTNKNPNVDSLINKFYKENIKNTKDQVRLPTSAVEYWGPCAWKLIHTVTLTYFPPEDKKKKKIYQDKFKTFFKSLADVLPCPVCRHHYQTRIYDNIEIGKTSKEFNDAFESTENLVKYYFNFHNKVNETRGKRDFIKYRPSLNFQEFMDRYSYLTTWTNKNPSYMADPYWGKPPTKIS